MDIINNIPTVTFILHKNFSSTYKKEVKKISIKDLKKTRKNYTNPKAQIKRN